MKCGCSDTKHGHGNPCGQETKGNATKCSGCEEKAAKEFGGTKNVGTPQDVPPRNR
jgi:hypothetical protein